MRDIIDDKIQERPIEKLRKKVREKRKWEFQPMISHESDSDLSIDT